ncbi:MAG: biosynthetic-type acetolactate synthase large subunit [Deltaproteobacteria bacterium]|nr:biosynthetic-type acetolactate synthase large subunit [Deltaproteobacteria bacterium]MBW2051780.1 biosynthetic-type acetolactate synthase large subunit [Deltaproteobacteria bacterium]MBW2140626.1 biosynthetic-type acetolactate synthase large subunit [Deltaproteobacteria bacterium]MBW2323311.1 biosynthetic-type acetolactate synthase large subunit [Deltaproteobacteria bacterium]
MELSGAEILLECLNREGVEVIFGYPGGVITDIYDHLPKTKIRHVLVRHEQAAVHAADSYARASGKVGVVLVTSGPGATNTVTGIASAFMDSVPLVVITGQVPTGVIGNDAFQEVDIVGITRSCTKHNYLVKEISSLAKTVKEAFHLASTGRPGPILVDLPKDVISGKTEFKYPRKVIMRSYKPTYEAHPKQIRKAFDLMAKSKKPVIYAGGGVISSGAHRELTALAELMQIPVTTTLMGLGGFPGVHELWLGMLGMHGTYQANMAVAACDLLIAVGARFDDRVTGKLDEFCPDAKMIHIDIDPTSIKKNVDIHVPIVGDCRNALSKALNLAKEEFKDREMDGGGAGDRQSWLKQIQTWRETYSLEYEQTDDGPIKPQYVVEEIYRLTKGKAIITTEVGQNQMWAAQYYNFTKPRTFITSGGLGCMGFGLPAALGAQIAHPKKLVIDIAGDGSIQMNIQELATAVENKLPVKVAILNNQYLGMVRQFQEIFYDKRYVATSLASAPDFVKLSEAYGAVGLRAEKPGEVTLVLEEAFNIKRPVVMDFRVAREECVYPMVPAGAAMTNMLLA